MQNNPMRFPVLSVVIPTRNRMQYAVAAIKNVLEIQDERLELIIQDNSDDRTLGLWLEENIKDCRVRYNHTVTHLSFIANFNMAAELSSGEYLCFIGDDDGVMPEVLDAALWAKKENIDVVAVQSDINYIWPGTGLTPTLLTKEVEALLNVPCRFGKMVRADTVCELERYLRGGGLNYLNYLMPKLYHGIVHRRCLSAVKSKAGDFFGGLSPDIFAAIAIALVAKNVVVTDYPLTIPGSCAVSGSIMEGRRRNMRRLEDAPHFKNRGRYNWCEFIPRIYTVETIWADSAIAALRAMGRMDMAEHFDLTMFSAGCIAANCGVSLLVLVNLADRMRLAGKSPCLAVGKCLFLVLRLCVSVFIRRVLTRLRIVFGVRQVVQIRRLNDIVTAAHALEVYLKSRGKRFQDLLVRSHESV